MNEIQKELIQLNKKLSKILYAFVIIFFIWILISVFLGENVFSYETNKEKTVKEPYEHIVDTVWDYTCYTTTYGECYHEKGCQYLSQHSKRTTVAKAKENGYRACSKCAPPKDLPVVIKETRYKTVTKIEKETKKPSALIWFIGTCIIISIYYIVTKDLRKQIDILALKNR